MDPEISKTVARQQAWNIVKTFDPTLVPKELATSFAPIPKAKIRNVCNNFYTFTLYLLSFNKFIPTFIMKNLFYFYKSLKLVKTMGGIRCSI